jgi:kinesin family member 6/9
VNQLVTGPIQCTMEDLADRARAFEMFRKSYRKNEAMEENRNLLKDKYARGKELGNEVNESRNGIKNLTNKIEQIRKENAMRGLVDPSTGEVLKTPEEEALQLQVNKLKMSYQT